MAGRVTAVEFASDSDDAWRVFYFRPIAVWASFARVFWTACVGDSARTCYDRSYAILALLLTGVLLGVLRLFGRDK